MKSVRNKSQRPVSIPLPRGKMLHLGPGRTGQIATAAAEHAPLKKLVDAGEIEILEADTGAAGGAASGNARRHAMHGVGWGSGRHRSGDR